MTLEQFAQRLFSSLEYAAAQQTVQQSNRQGTQPDAQAKIGSDLSFHHYSLKEPQHGKSMRQKGPHSPSLILIKNGK